MEIKSGNIDKIAYLGIGGSYSEIAKDIFCQKYNIETYQTSLRTIEEIVDYVDTYPNTLGVIPYENQMEGIIRKTIDTDLSEPDLIQLNEDIDSVLEDAGVSTLGGACKKRNHNADTAWREIYDMDVICQEIPFETKERARIKDFRKRGQQ